MDKISLIDKQILLCKSKLFELNGGGSRALRSGAVASAAVTLDRIEFSTDEKKELSRLFTGIMYEAHVEMVQQYFVDIQDAQFEKLSTVDKDALKEIFDFSVLHDDHEYSDDSVTKQKTDDFLRHELMKIHLADENMEAHMEKIRNGLIHIYKTCGLNNNYKAQYFNTTVCPLVAGKLSKITGRCRGGRSGAMPPTFDDPAWATGSDRISSDELYKILDALGKMTPEAVLNGVSNTCSTCDEVNQSSFEKGKHCMEVIFQDRLKNIFWSSFAKKRVDAIRKHVHVTNQMGSYNMGDAFIAKLAVEENLISVIDDFRITTAAAAAASAAAMAAVASVNRSQAAQAAASAASTVMSTAVAIIADETIIPKTKYDRLLGIMNGGSYFY